jgi:hypothetical protein
MGAPAIDNLRAEDQTVSLDGLVRTQVSNGLMPGRSPLGIGRLDSANRVYDGLLLTLEKIDSSGLQIKVTLIPLSSFVYLRISGAGRLKISTVGLLRI